MKVANLILVFKNYNFIHKNTQNQLTRAFFYPDTRFTVQNTTTLITNSTSTYLGPKQDIR